MRRRTPARFLAPVALVTCAVAIYAVVEGTLNEDSGGSATTNTATATTKGTTSTTKRTKTTAARKKTYIVKSGDVLSAIAARTGVSVAELMALNPDVDAQTLHPGQKLKLTR